MFDRLITACLSLSLVRPRLVLLVCALVVAGLGVGLPRLSVSNDYRVFFSSDNPQLAAQDALEARYSKVDNVAFVLRWEDGTVFEPGRLAVIRNLTERLWTMAHVTRVDSLTNYQFSRALGDDLEVADLISDPQSLDAEARTQLRRTALAEPGIASRLLSPDARTTLLNATVHYGEAGASAQPRIAAEARSIARQLEQDTPGLTVATTGIVMLSNAFDEATRHDLKTLFPAMGVVLVLVMVLLLRSISATVASMVVVGAAVLGALGLAGLLGYQLNPASGVGPVIILTVAIADSIHLIVGARAALAQGQRGAEALATSLRINAGPIFLTSATTAVGFLSLNFSDAPPFRELGNICAAGALLAWLFSMSLLPAWLVLFPLKEKAVDPTGPARPYALQPFVDWVVGHRGAIVVGTLALSCLFAATLPGLVINDKFVEFFAPGTEFRDDADFVGDHLPGVYLMDFSVSAGQDGDIADPSYLAALDGFARWLRDQPEVTHVDAFSDVLKRLNRNLHGDDPSWYRLPSDREAAAQYTLLYELSLPFGLDLNNRLDLSKSATRVTATLDNIPSGQLKGLKARAEAWLKENGTPAMAGTTATGVSTIFSFLTDRNIRSMFWGTGIALVIISLLLMLALRDVKMGIISLLPNLTPPIFAFGLWALLVGEIGLYASAVTAAALGLIVDFTVHFLSKYRRARREKGLDAVAGVHYAFETVGQALWVCAGVLFCGFSVLGFSDFLVNANLGIMTALIIVIALATDFLLLPAILLLLDRPKPVGGKP